MKKLFLTGGSGGIGGAIKQEFLAKGYQVTAPSSAELDLAVSDRVAAYFQQVPAEFDVIIHCAGYNHPRPLAEVSFEEYQRTQNINLYSFIQIVQHNLAYFKKHPGGRILAMASLYGEIARAGRLAYTVAKHGLVGAVQTMAVELGRYKVCCNALSPGFVDTPMTRQNLSAEAIKKIAGQIPLGGLTTPEEIAQVAFFLCSPANTAISGQNIIVDGGYLAGGFQS